MLSPPGVAEARNRRRLARRGGRRVRSRRSVSAVSTGCAKGLVSRRTCRVSSRTSGRHLLARRDDEHPEQRRREKTTMPLLSHRAPPMTAAARRPGGAESRPPPRARPPPAGRSGSRPPESSGHRSPSEAGPARRARCAVIRRCLLLDCLLAGNQRVRDGVCSGRRGRLRRASCGDRDHLRVWVDRGADGRRSWSTVRRRLDSRRRTTPSSSSSAD